MNRQERCRTCLCTNKEMRSVHAVITIAGDNVKLSDILQNFYNHEVTDNESYPDILCINCVTQLTLTYSFKVLIETSLKTLSDTYNSSYAYADNNFDNSDSNDIKPTVYISGKQKIKKKKESEQEQEIVFCVECKVQFNSRNLLYNHCLSNHPNNQVEGKKCDYCNYLFEDFRSLVIHRKQHENPYLCENCWKGYLSIDELNNHVCQPKNNRGRDKVKAGQAIQQCDQCGKSYPNSYMRVHMMIHGNDLKYSCKYCPKKFKVPGSLNSHILWNHKRTRDHKCEVCNATFISASSRSTHIRKHHLKEKKYACENCAKRFFSKSELERHMLTHTGVKNFHCQLCEKSYQTRHGLNVHLKSHPLNVNVTKI